MLVGSVRPGRAVWLDEALEAQPWGVDWRLAREEEDIVEEATEHAAKERRHHWDLLP